MSLILERCASPETERCRGEMPDLRAEPPPPVADRIASLRRALPWIVAWRSPPASRSRWRCIRGRAMRRRQFRRRGDSDDAGRRRVPATAGRRRANAANTAHRRTRTAEASAGTASRDTGTDAGTRAASSRPPPDSIATRAFHRHRNRGQCPARRPAQGAAAAAAEHAHGDPDPAKRFVILDGERHAEGDSVGPMRIRRIDAGACCSTGTAVRSGCRHAEEPMPGIDFELTAISSNSTSCSAGGLCESGGAGKQLVASGAVRVDGAVELRKTAKIRAGQRVRVGEVEIRDRGLKPAPRSARAPVPAASLSAESLPSPPASAWRASCSAACAYSAIGASSGQRWSGKPYFGNNFTAGADRVDVLPRLAAIHVQRALERFLAAQEIASALAQHAQPFQVFLHRVRAPRPKECNFLRAEQAQVAAGTVIIRWRWRWPRRCA